MASRKRIFVQRRMEASALAIMSWHRSPRYLIFSIREMIQKEKTFNEITKLSAMECLYMSCTGNCRLSAFTGWFTMSFQVEGAEDAQITVEYGSNTAEVRSPLTMQMQEQ